MSSDDQLGSAGAESPRHAIVRVPARGLALRANACVQAPKWARGFDNLTVEHGFEPLRIEGVTPGELRGTFYWNGPGQLSAFGRHYGHWFDGDGAVGGARFAQGRVEGAVKMVQTPSLLRERAAGRLLWSRFGMRSPRPISEYLRRDFRNSADTGIWAYRGALLALSAQGLPVGIHHDDLSTLAETDFDGAIMGGLTSHPRWIESKRAFYNIGLRVGPRSFVDVYELPHQGAIRRLQSFGLDRPVLVHDFAVTPRFIVVLLPPLRFRTLRIALNLDSPAGSLKWDPQAGTQLLVVPIDDPANAVRIEAPAFMAYHVANAYEQGDQIIIDLPASGDARHSRAWFEAVSRGRQAPWPGFDLSLHRLSIDVAARRASLEPLTDHAGEMPRVSPRVANLPHRFVYTHGFACDRRGMPEVLLKTDVISGRVASFSAGFGTFPGEATFIPRSNPSCEDDGHLVCLVYDGNTHTSYVAAFDARQPGRPPVLRAHFAHHVPFNFHGLWVPDEHGSLPRATEVR